MKKEIIEYSHKESGLRIKCEVDTSGKAFAGINFGVVFNGDVVLPAVLAVTEYGIEIEGYEILARDFSIYLTSRYGARWEEKPVVEHETEER